MFLSSVLLIIAVLLVNQKNMERFATWLANQNAEGLATWFVNQNAGKAAVIIIGISIAVIIVIGLMHTYSRRRYLIIATPSDKLEIDFRLYGKRKMTKFVRKLGSVLTSHQRRSHVNRR